LFSSRYKANYKLKNYSYHFLRVWYGEEKGMLLGGIFRGIL